MGHRVPVFYVPAMVGRPDCSFSPSAGKPTEVVNDWQTVAGLAEHIDIVEFPPVERRIVRLAHDPNYVDDILERRIANGFGDSSLSVAKSLPYTSGSMLAAALHVLAQPGDWSARSRIACSPSSGFHHAHYARGRGFCTFNGLMITAIELKRLGLIDQLLVLDCDEHYGDGTQEIIERLGLAWISHVTHGGNAPGSYRSKADLMASIAAFMPRFAGPRSIVLYQAGADCHVDDPLGGFLTTEDMYERDTLVFSLAVAHRAPLVWNFAGGYQRDSRGSIDPVLQLHRNTMAANIAAAQAG